MIYTSDRICVAAAAESTFVLQRYEDVENAILWADARTRDGVPAHASITRIIWNGDSLICTGPDGGLPVSLAHLMGVLTRVRGEKSDTKILVHHDLRVSIRNDSNESIWCVAGLRLRQTDDEERAMRFRAATAHAVAMLEEAIGWAT